MYKAEALEGKMKFNAYSSSKSPLNSSPKYPPTFVERIQFYLDPGTGGDFGEMGGYFGPMGFTPGFGPSQRLCPL